jgi:hypothetical protein
MRFKKMTRPHDRTPTTRHAVAILSAALLVTGVLQGCTGPDEAPPASRPAATAIEPIEGMKYYVGGPVMKFDQYGRMRLGGFNGEISSPTSRGLLLGFKKNADSTFDYRTWLNGAIITESKGFVDAEGLLWYTERVSYDANGDVTVRQKFQYDDQAKVMKSVLDHVDPATGEVAKSITQEIPYAPTDSEKKAMFEEDSEGEGEGDAEPAE